MLLSLSILFKRPRRIYARYDKYGISGQTRELTQKDQDFIDRHLRRIETHQNLIMHQKRPFMSGEIGNQMITLPLVLVTFLIVFSSEKLAIWLTGSVLGNDDPATIVLQHNSPLLSLLILLLILILTLTIWPIVLHRVIIKNNNRVLTYDVLMPFNPHKVGSEKLKNALDEGRPSIALDLSNLLKMNLVDKNRHYQVNKLVEIITYHQSRTLNRIGLTTLAFTLLLLIMNLFSYVKVTPDKIVYSPAFSFEAIEKDFEDVIDAYYFCRRNDGKRYLELRIELDNGYKINVHRTLIEDMFVVLDAANIPQGNIADQKAWCDNLK